MSIGTGLFRFKKKRRAAPAPATPAAVDPPAMYFELLSVCAGCSGALSACAVAAGDADADADADADDANVGLELIVEVDPDD